MGLIGVYTPDEVDRIVRFFIDDTKPDGERISFIQANFNQHLMVQRPQDFPYEVFCHNQRIIDEVVESLEEITGLVFPEDFSRGTAVYNVYGILMDKGVGVTHRVLRQQIFLGARIVPIPSGETWHYLFNAIGNALWNFLDHKVWRDRTEKNEVKNLYREIRGITQENLPRRGHGRNKYQQNLFFIAAEDFRYLFGPALAGRGEWFLEEGSMPIPHPSEDVADFWRKELGRYDEIYSSGESPDSESPAAYTEHSGDEFAAPKVLPREGVPEDEAGSGVVSN